MIPGDTIRVRLDSGPRFVRVVRVLSLATGELSVALATVALDGHVTESEVKTLVQPALSRFDRAAEPFRAPVLSERAS